MITCAPICRRHRQLAEVCVCDFDRPHLACVCVCVCDVSPSPHPRPPCCAQPDLLLNAGTCGGFKRQGGAVGDVYISTAFKNHDRSVRPDAWGEMMGGRREQRRRSEEQRISNRAAVRERTTRPREGGGVTAAPAPHPALTELGNVPSRARAPARGARSERIILLSHYLARGGVGGSRSRGTRSTASARSTRRRRRRSWRRSASRRAS